MKTTFPKHDKVFATHEMWCLELKLMQLKKKKKKKNSMKTAFPKHDMMFATCETWCLEPNLARSNQFVH